MRIPSWPLGILLLSACIVPPPAVKPQAYDFGPPPAASVQALVARPVLAVADVQAPRWLDGNFVQYRLAFSDAQAPKPYANSRWAMSPPQLLTQRLKHRLAQQASVIAVGDAASSRLLKVELEQFDQVFDTPASSRGVVRFRASLIGERRLLAQKTFATEAAAPTADASGGVRALTQAADAALESLAAWVAEQPAQ